MAALVMVDERLDPVRMPVATLLDLVAARRRGLEMALALGFPVPDATQVAAVISEFGRQAIFLGGGGMLTLIAQVTGRRGLKIVIQDRGPGIADIEAVVAGRCPVPATLRREVLEAGRLMNEFEIRSIVGGGTTIRATRWVA